MHIRSGSLALLALTTTFLIALAGCSSSGSDASEAPGDDDGIAEDDAELKAGKLVGTYRIDVADPEGSGVYRWLETMSLKSDGTFYTDESAVVFGEDGQNSQVGHSELRGSYTLKKSRDGKSKWLSFSYLLPADGRAQFKYFYKTDAAGVRIAADMRGTEPDSDFLPMKLDRINAWCAEATDCALQNLPQPRCPGQWECTKVQRAASSIDACRYKGTRCGG